MKQAFFNLSGGEGPLVAAAIHDGHAIRPVLNAYLNLSAKQRLREENPYTGTLASLFSNHIIVNFSRFEIDLNRPRSKAIYLKPEDAWGLHVWRESLPKDEVRESLLMHDQFYAAVTAYFQKIIDKWGFLVVYDIHSYNHRRGGPQSTPADAKANPEINLGLSNMNLRQWRPLIDTFTTVFKNSYPEGVQPDIRENVKFEGGHFVRWIHERFGSKACAIAIEFKKVFMDEWTNEVDQCLLNALGSALKATEKPVLEVAKSIIRKPEGFDRSKRASDSRTAANS